MKKTGGGGGGGGGADKKKAHRHAFTSDTPPKDQTFSDNYAFFAWAFVKRHPLWQSLLSFSWPVLTLAICLFPVYLHRCKLLILYSFATRLLIILCLLLLRGLIFGSLWILLGKHVWFFPNILAEEATLKELFQFWPKKDEEEPPKWTTRLFYLIVSVTAILLLKHHAPDEATRARYQKRVSNIIVDVPRWSLRLALSGMIEKHAVANVSEPSNNFTKGNKAGSGHDINHGGMNPQQGEVDEKVFRDVQDADNEHHQYDDL